MAHSSTSLRKLPRFQPTERRRNADRAASGRAGVQLAADPAPATPQRPTSRMLPRRRAYGRACRGGSMAAATRLDRPASAATPRHSFPWPYPGRTPTLRRSRARQMSARSPRDRERTAAIDQAAELGRQGMPLVRRQGASIASAMAASTRARSGPASGPTMTLRTASVSASGSSRPSDRSCVAQVRRAFLAEAADLEVGAARQIDVAVAQRSPRCRPARRLLQREAPQPTAGRARAGRRRSAIGRCMPGHQPLIVGHGTVRLMSEPSVIRPGRGSRRDRIQPRDPQAAHPARRAAGAAMAAAAAGFFSSIAASTASSEISAACVASNRWPGTASAVAAKA